MGALDRLRRRDAGLLALRRAARTAVVMPAAFALGGLAGDRIVALYAAFGAFALLLIVDFGGRMADRVRAQIGLGVAGAVLVAVGSLVAPYTWAATATMALVAFAILFAGVVSSVLAGATTALLLPFILSSSLPGPPGGIPARLAGWGLATAVSVVAIAVLWPAPPAEALRARLIDAVGALADRLRAEVSAALDLPGGDPAAATAHASEVIGRLQRDFYGMPYRPTGLSTGDRALVRVVDELTFLNQALQVRPTTGPRPACKTRFAAAVALRSAAELLNFGDPAPLHVALEDLRRAVRAVEDGPLADATALDPSFRAQEIAFAVASIAANIELTAQADRRTLAQRLLGWQPSGIGTPLAAARERAAAHLAPHSVWLHNSIRAAAGLALAVLVARVTGVQNAFWVVLGALSVLRSNALNTGQTAARALLGTLAGIAIGGALLPLVGTNRVLLWALLPPAILLAGLAPAAISFAAGQAAFTLVIFVLFNLIAPTGWQQTGIVRLEDVALGCGVSLVVGLLFWPRGAERALDAALAAAYRDSAAYLRSAVAYGAFCCHGAGSDVPPRAEASRAAAANRRLDDAFRTYLGERGAKPVPLTDVTRLVTGVAGLRLAADAVLDLWSGGPSGVAAGDRAAAGFRLEAAGEAVAGWYAELADALSSGAPVPDPPAPDPGTAPMLRAVVERDLTQPGGAATAVAVRMVWTAGHLDAARRLQPTLLGPARLVTASTASGGSSRR